MEQVMETVKPSSRLYPMLVWFIGATFYFYEFFIQVSPNVMVPELMNYFQVNATHLSALTLTYFIAYASMQLPGGILLDRFGPRRLMTVAVLFCAVGSLVFATTKLFAMAELARFVTGLGSAFALLGTLVLTANWFSSRYFATLSGLLLTVGMSGAIFGEAPLAYAIERYHWQNVVYFLGLVGIILALLLWLIVRDRGAPPTTPRKKATLRRVTRNTLNILKSKATWLTAAFGALMFAPTVVFGTLWGISFLTARFDMPRTSAAILVSLLFVGWAVGCPLFGNFSDRLGKRKPPLYVSSVGALLTILPLLYLPHLPYMVVGVLLTLLGFFSSGFVIAFSICRELHSFEYSGAALGFMNMINTLSAAASPVLVAIVMDFASRGEFSGHGPRVYSSHDYVLAFSLLPIFLTLALALLPLVKETHGKPTIQ